MGDTSNRFAPLASDESTQSGGSPTHSDRNAFDANYVTMDAGEVSSIGIQQSNSDTTTHGNSTNASDQGVNTTASPRSSQSWYERTDPSLRRAYQGMQTFFDDLHATELGKRINIQSPDSSTTWRVAPPEFLAKCCAILAAKHGLPMGTLAPIMEFCVKLWKDHGLQMWDDILMLRLDGEDDLATAFVRHFVRDDVLYSLLQGIGFGNDGFELVTDVFAMGTYLHRGLAAHVQSFDQPQVYRSATMPSYNPFIDPLFDQTLDMAKEMLGPLLDRLQVKWSSAEVDRVEASNLPMPPSPTLDTSSGITSPPVAKSTSPSLARFTSSGVVKSSPSNRSKLNPSVPTGTPTNQDSNAMTPTTSTKRVTIAPGTVQSNQTPDASVNQPNVTRWERADLPFPDLEPPGLATHYHGRWCPGPDGQPIWKIYSSPLDQGTLPLNVSKDQSHWRGRLYPNDLFYTIQGDLVDNSNPQHPDHIDNVSQTSNANGNHQPTNSMPSHGLGQGLQPPSSQHHAQQSAPGYTSSTKGLYPNRPARTGYTRQQSHPTTGSSAFQSRHPWLPSQSPWKTRVSSGSGGGGSGGNNNGGAPPHWSTPHGPGHGRGPNRPGGFGPGGGGGGPPPWHGPSGSGYGPGGNGGPTGGGGSGGGGGNGPPPSTFMSGTPKPKPWSTKPDRTAFRKLRDPSDFTRWDTHTTIQMQWIGIQQLNWINHVPMTAAEAEEDQKMNEWMFSVLYENVQTTVGKAIVHAHRGTFDARAALFHLRQDAVMSASGKLQQRQLRQQIITARLDSTWKKSQMDFLIAFDRLIEDYNEKIDDPTHRILDQQKKDYLESAVHPAHNLREVATREIEAVVARHEPPYSYQQYYICLETAAQLYDSANSTARRRIHHIDTQAVNEDPVDYDGDVDDSPHSRNAFQAATRRSTRPRLPDAKWSQLSSNGKSIWNQLSDTDKAAIVNEAANARSINYHGHTGYQSMDTDATTEALTESSTTDDPESPSTTPDRAVHSAVSSLGETPTPAKSPKPPTAIADAHPGDPRRLLSPKNKATKAANRTANMVTFAPTHDQHDAAVAAYWDTQDTFFDAQDF